MVAYKVVPINRGTPMYHSGFLIWGNPHKGSYRQAAVRKGRVLGLLVVSEGGGLGFRV